MELGYVKVPVHDAWKQVLRYSDRRWEMSSRRAVA